jgi:hypothetical protein
MMRRAGWMAVVFVVLTGCGDVTRPIASTSRSSPIESQFDAATTGTLRGEVNWTGPIPTVAPITINRFTPDATRVEHLQFVNPHAPAVNESRQLANAIVFLRGVDPAKAKPWHHPPVTVEVADGHAMIRQGDSGYLVGFVKRGDSITMVSRQPIFHAVRARGAAFFTYTLPDANQPRQRVLAQNGRVELSSAASQMALRGHIFVDEHPYYTRTDANGRFQLEQVPAGKYELVCWRPNWNIERIEHDPETLLNARLYYKAPFEKVVNVSIEAGGTASTQFDVGAE